MGKDSVRILQAGDRVLLLIDGRLVADMPHQAAFQVSRAFYSVGKKAEEWANAEAIAKDQGLLLRAGVPIAITDEEKIAEEARQIAMHDRDLRRFIRFPRYPEKVGRPTVKKGATPCLKN